MELDKIKNGIICEPNIINLIEHRRLKDIISPISFNLDKEEKVFICDNKKVYAVVVLNKANIIDRDQFKNHFSRHLIKQEVIDKQWPYIKKFNMHTFRIKKVFKEPLDYIGIGMEYGEMSDIIKNIEVVDKEKENLYAKINKYKVRLETLKGLNFSGKNELIKEVIAGLFSLIIERMEEKAAHKKRKRKGKKKPARMGMKNE